MGRFNQECQCTFFRLINPSHPSRPTTSTENGLQPHQPSSFHFRSHQTVALGDLSKQVNVDVQGEMLDLKETVNSMVHQLNTLTNEVTRVSLEVGTEGILGGQASVPDVQGMWKVCTLVFLVHTPYQHYHSGLD